LDLTMLVAPLTVVDSVAGRIPVVRDVAGSGLVSIPVKVGGRIGDPSVVVLSPSAVGSELTGLMRKAGRLPRWLIRPLMPGKKSDQPSS